MWEFFRSKGNLMFKATLLVFAVMMFMSASVGISYYMLAFAIMVLFFTNPLKYIDKTAIYLLLFSIFYSLILLLREPNIKVIIYFVCPFVFYTFGRQLVNKFNTRALIIFFAISILLFGLRTYIATSIDIREVGFINPYRAMNRSGIGDVDMAATLFGVNVSLGFAGIATLIVKPEKIGISKFILPAVFILSLITVLHLVNRTGIAVMAMSILAIMVYSSPRRSTKIIFVGGFIIALAFLLVPAMQGAFSDIGSAYEVREGEIDGGTLTMGNRLWRWADAIQRIFSDPFGWDGQAEYYYVHNMWLDVARLTGILPFFMILLATISGLKTIIKLYRRKNNPLIALMIGLAIVTLATAFVEPIIEGFDLYFYMMCMFWGISAQYLKQI